MKKGVYISANNALQSQGFNEKNSLEWLYTALQN